MKYILENISITTIFGLALIPIVLSILFIPFLRCLACILMFYVLLNFGLDGIEEEYKAEHQAEIDSRKQANKN